MIRLCIEDGRCLTQASVDDVRAVLQDDSKRFWLDIEGLSDAQEREVLELFQFEERAIERCLGHSKRPKVVGSNDKRDAHGNPYYYLVVHGPHLELSARRDRSEQDPEKRFKEVDIFLSERYLLTLHKYSSKALAGMMERVRHEPGLLAEGTDMLLYRCLDLLADSYERVLSHVGPIIDALDDAALERPGPEVLRRISMIKRALFELRRNIGPERELVAQITRGEVPIVREGARGYLRDVQDHMFRYSEVIDSYREQMAGARDIYLSSISNRLNEIMKTLTVISVIALPLTVITSFFGMNFEGIPGLHSRRAFWMTVAVMLASVVGLLLWFRRKGWLGKAAAPSQEFMAHWKEAETKPVEAKAHSGEAKAQSGPEMEAAAATRA